MPADAIAAVLLDCFPIVYGLDGFRVAQGAI